MSYFVDTHCHLDLLKGIQVNAASENTDGLKSITVTNAPSFYLPNQQLFAKMENIRIALGLHPQLVMQYAKEITLLEQQMEVLKYVGEIGLDGSADLKESYPTQVRIFERVLSSIRKSSPKVITIHSRNAAAETIQLLTRYLKGTQHRVILHWFTGNKIELGEGIRHNFYFSVNHKMANKDKGKEAIKMIPDHLLLTETDAPFTFGQQITKRLQSIEETLQVVALIKKISLEQSKAMVFQNFKNMITF